MSRLQIVLGIALFALATAILYVWGLKRSLTQQEDMQRTLYSKCAGRIVRYLKKNGTVTEKEMETLIVGVKAGQFWSRRRVAIQDPGPFTGQLVAFLIDQQLLEPTGKKKEYRLKR